MRISDWSSDVCSSDLQTSARLICGFTGDGRRVVPLSVPAGVSSTDGPPPKSQGKYMTVNMKNWQELKKPNSLEIKAGGDPKRKATFVAEPLERGFGLTLGNALRRVLLSSLQAADVTSIKRCEYGRVGYDGVRTGRRCSSPCHEKQQKQIT